MSNSKDGFKPTASPSVAIAAVLLLVTLVGVVALATSSSQPTVLAPPPQCLTLWNSSRGALIVGYHSYHSHEYERAQVVRLTPAGEPRRRGRCGVVFPSNTLDTEWKAAAKIYSVDRWRPLTESGLVSAVRLSELQAEAVDRSNATLHPDGTLTAGP